MRPNHLSRREFITLLGGAAASWPLAARAQHLALPVVALITNGSPDDSAPVAAALVAQVSPAREVRSTPCKRICRTAQRG